jgi:metal-responsive CopG/Arc/MetJ family transcriptional regulator
MANQAKAELVPMKVDIPRSLDRAVEAAAFKREQSKRSIVIAALRHYLGMEKAA